MFITLGDVRSEIASLFKEYNFLKTCNADDALSKNKLESEKLRILDAIKEKHDFIFDKLGIDDGIIKSKI